MKKALIVALAGATLVSLTACGIGKDPLRPTAAGAATAPSSSVPRISPKAS
ncbi:hypothetical protein MLGJGCBP_06082 [Rhodococcus sp. T7]|nr:hypothetical protein MLGJGCBP_06082 [Rhodococcus sp. T7]